MPDAPWHSARPHDFDATPWDGDTLHEECGVFGAVGLTDAANFVALDPSSDATEDLRI